MKYLYFSNAGDEDAVNDIACYPVSSFRGFAISAADAVTSVSWSFNPLLDPLWVETFILSVPTFIAASVPSPSSNADSELAKPPSTWVICLKVDPIVCPTKVVAIITSHYCVWCFIHNSTHATKTIFLICIYQSFKFLHMKISFIILLFIFSKLSF